MWPFESGVRAQHLFSSRKFDGRDIVATFIDSKQFDRLKKDMQRAAEEAAKAPPPPVDDVPPPPPPVAVEELDD